MLFTSLIVQVVMIVTLEKLNVIYAQERKNMLAVMKEAPFMTILRTYYSYFENLFRFNNDSFDKALLSINSVQSNTKIIDSALDWNILLIKEALLIKQKMPKLNNGLKASKELKLFN